LHRADNNSEPNIQAALLQNVPEARLKLERSYFLPDGRAVAGEFDARTANGQVVLRDADGKEILRQKEILLSPDASTEAFLPSSM